jgi:hypothetical protein
MVEQILERVLLEKSVGDKCVMGLVTSVNCQSVSEMKRSRHVDLMEQARAEAEKACRVPEIAAAQRRASLSSKSLVGCSRQDHWVDGPAL